MLKLTGEALREELERCCGSRTWVAAVEDALSPAGADLDRAQILEESERAFERLSENDWLEAFSHHPKIGDLESLERKFASTAELAGAEQSGARFASTRTLEKLRQANEKYERRFGYIFIVFATGKTAAEMLQLLEARLGNDRESELRCAAQEQRKITRSRLETLAKA